MWGTRGNPRIQETDTGEKVWSYTSYTSIWYFKLIRNANPHGIPKPRDITS